MRRRPSLRRRLTLALVAVAVAVLALSAGLTYFLVRATAHDAALDDLRDEAEVVGDRLLTLRRFFKPGRGTRDIEQALRNIRFISQLADARIVFVDDEGRILDGNQTSAAGVLSRQDRPGPAVFELPPQLAESDLDGFRLLAGETVSGSDGDTLFVARPLGRVPPDAPEQVVLVLTDTFSTDVVGRAGPLFLVGAGIALVVMILVALWLARRLTRPLQVVEETAARLAQGDLSARARIDDRTVREPARLAETLNDMADQLERARGSERAFLLSVSHDLRTPLTSIRGYAAAIADGTIDPSDETALAHATEIIGGEARRLERLVRDLLDLARLDAREFSLHPRPDDAGRIVAEAVEAFRPAADDLGLELRTVVSDRPLDVVVDPERLGQIVANLVENALKYAESRVDVAVHRDDAWLEIEVTDDGPGIPEGDLHRVFERLYTARGLPGRPVGTGLGLAIVRELAHAMDGECRVERSVGGRARFLVRVPAIEPPPRRSGPGPRRDVAG